MSDQIYTYTDLAIAYLDSDPDKGVSDEDNVILFDVGDDCWDALKKISEQIVEFAKRSAEQGASSMSFTQSVVEERISLNLDCPDMNLENQIALGLSRRSAREGSRSAEASARVYIGEEMCSRCNLLYHHGSVDVMKFMIDCVYDNLTNPHKIATLGTDYASIRWIPRDFDPEEDDPASLAQALRVGVPYDDVFAAYDLRSVR